MPLVRPSTKDVEEPEWVNTYGKFVELHRAVNLKKAGSQQESKGAVVDERRQGKWRSSQ